MREAEIERVALAIFKSNMHPEDAADEALVARCRREWPTDWMRSERAAMAAIAELSYLRSSEGHPTDEGRRAPPETLAEPDEAALERAARALCETSGQDPDETGCFADHAESPAWRNWLPDARAALAALKDSR